MTTSFAPLADAQLGVYAVVDSAEWVRRVLAAGIRTVQLRIKDARQTDLEAQVAQSIALGRATAQAQVFINDHWALALRHGAYGVHLGQDDLDHAELAALRAAGVRLGVSTHSEAEVERALALQPSYIAVGPVFPTQSKAMPWIAQGLENLRYWVCSLPQPVVAIAGIDAGNIAAVAQQGVAGAALITAITAAAAPESACQTLQQQFAHGQTLARPAPPLRPRPTLA